MHELSAQLEYAPAPSRQGPRTRRAVIATALIVAAVIGGRWAGPAINHGRLLYHQGRCLARVGPADRAVYDSQAPLSLGRASDWDQFYELFSPPGGRPAPVLFVHERRAKHGDARLVAVVVDVPPADAVDAGRPPTFSSKVLAPAGLTRAAELRTSAAWVSPLETAATPVAPRPRPLRLFAGQADADNPAHFTIAFDYAGQRGTIDGWLQVDDTVLFELREPLRRLSVAAK